MALIPKFDDNERGNPLKELTEGTFAPTVFYPDNLENLDHWVRFAVVKRTKPWRDSSDKANQLASIYLPIPSQLSTGYSLNYENTGIGALGTIGAKAGNLARDVIGGKASVGNLIDTLKSNSAEVNIQKFRGALSEGGALAANFIVSGDTGSGLEQFPYIKDLIHGATFGSGLTPNPHQAMLFNTVEFRKHTFAYQFAAKNADESDMIRKIIYLFKYHSAPEFRFAGHNFFEYPDEFDISFHYPEYLFTIAPSVLTNIGINYSGNEQAAFFYETHAPVHITITMDFNELTIATKERIKEFGR